MIMKRITYLLFSIFLLQTATAQLSVTNLRCEMMVNPLGIEAKQPRLSWQLNSDLRNVVQTSYQVIVSSSPANLLLNKGDVWNSGVVNSPQSIHVLYNGPALKPATHFYWKVLVSTNKGSANTLQTAFFQQAWPQRTGRPNGSGMIKGRPGIALPNGPDSVPVTCGKNFNQSPL